MNVKIVKVKNASKQYGDRAVLWHYPAHYELQTADGVSIARITYEDGGTPKPFRGLGLWRVRWLLTDHDIQQSAFSMKKATEAAQKLHDNFIATGDPLG